MKPLTIHSAKLSRPKLIPALTPVLLVFLAPALESCSTPPRAGSQDVEFNFAQSGGGGPSRISQSMLQEALFRFAGRFGDLLRDSMKPLTDSRSDQVRRQALANHVLYASSALDIALGPRERRALKRCGPTSFASLLSSEVRRVKSKTSALTCGGEGSSFAR